MLTTELLFLPCAPPKSAHIAPPSALHAPPIAWPATRVAIFPPSQSISHTRYLLATQETRDRNVMCPCVCAQSMMQSVMRFCTEGARHGPSLTISSLHAPSLWHAQATRAWTVSSATSATRRTLLGAANALRSPGALTATLPRWRVQLQPTTAL